MASSPLISVCVPTYNGERYLRQCLESVLEQSCDDFEIVAIDDTSTDGTLDILHAFAAADSRIRVSRNATNNGLVPNWNRCIDVSRGSWIKFLFQDDYLEPACLRTVLDAASAPLVFSRRNYLFDDVSPEVETWYTQYTGEASLDAAFPTGGLISKERFCEALLTFDVRNFVGEPTSALIHRDVFSRFGRFDARYTQICDLEFWLRVGANTGIVYVPEMLTNFRVHGASATSSNETQKKFAVHVIDALLLRHEFATSPHFQTLRRIALNANVDLQQRYRDKLLFEQCWGPNWRATDWNRFVRRHPALQIPLLPRIKRSVRRLLSAT